MRFAKMQMTVTLEMAVPVPAETPVGNMDLNDEHKAQFLTDLRQRYGESGVTISRVDAIAAEVVEV